MGLHNIIEFRLKSDNNLIGYFTEDFNLTYNIYLSKQFNIETDLKLIITSLLYSIYDGTVINNTNNITENKRGYASLYKDWFVGINKDDIQYNILCYEDELRNLKMSYIKKRKK